MTIDLKKVVEECSDKLAQSLDDTEAMDDYEWVLTSYDIPADRIAAIEQAVDRVGGDPKNVVIASGKSWDKMRLSVATDPEYIDRCREHPYFQDLLGKSYRGRVFE